MAKLTPVAIVVHCSASLWGDARAIRAWHQTRGWSDIGYHAVILNGHRTYRSVYDVAMDGLVEPGRALAQQGAHCVSGGMNEKALGVCLVGSPGFGAYPTARQLDALVEWCARACVQHGIQSAAITQHSDHEPGKPACASLRIAAIRTRVRARILELRA